MSGAISTIVQVTLALRASKVIVNPAVRWAYVVVLGCGALFGLLGSIGITYTSWQYHLGIYLINFRFQLSDFLVVWGCSAMATVSGVLAPRAPMSSSG